MGVNGHWYVEIEKQGYWRGAEHTWVNRYVISGAQPSASVATTIIGALHDIENALMPAIGAGGGVGFVAGKAYPSGPGYPFQTVEYNPSKNPASSTGWAGPSSAYSNLFWTNTLEACLDVRTLMTGLSSTGKPVYNRKYFRGFFHLNEDNGGGPIGTADLTKIAATCLPWTAGLGGTSYVVIGNSGRAASGVPTAQSWLGNHQVPRGKKKKTSAELAASAYSSGVATGLAAAPSTSTTETNSDNGNGGVHISIPFPFLDL